MTKIKLVGNDILCQTDNIHGLGGYLMLLRMLKRPKSSRFNAKRVTQLILGRPRTLCNGEPLCPGASLFPLLPLPCPYLPQSGSSSCILYNQPACLPPPQPIVVTTGIKPSSMSPVHLCRLCTGGAVSLVYIKSTPPHICLIL